METLKPWRICFTCFCICTLVTGVLNDQRVVLASHHSPDVIKKVDTTQPMVALTFDDGPSVTFTPQILSLLEQYHAKATFFVIGSRADKYPVLIQQELASRCEVANHSYNHTVLTGQSGDRVVQELRKAQHAIDVAGHMAQPHLFRPPIGLSDKSLLWIADQQRYKVVLWSVDSRDWADPGVSKITQNVMSHVTRGDIILFHDQGGNRSQTIRALQRVIPALEDRGFKLVTVSELLRAEDD